MGIQARNIVRFAKSKGERIEHGHSGRCARGMVAWMHGLTSLGTGDAYNKLLPKRTGRSVTDLCALEIGFESADPANSDYWLGVYASRGGYDGSLTALKKNRYYKVGQNVARLAGLVV